VEHKSTERIGPRKKKSNE